MPFSARQLQLRLVEDQPIENLALENVARSGSGVPCRRNSRSANSRRAPSSDSRHHLFADDGDDAVHQHDARRAARPVAVVQAPGPALGDLVQAPAPGPWHTMKRNPINPTRTLIAKRRSEYLLKRQGLVLHAWRYQAGFPGSDW